MTYRIPRRWMVSKQVNGGNWIALGTYDSEADAAGVIVSNREFHSERCPNDEVRYSLREV